MAKNEVSLVNIRASGKAFSKLIEVVSGAIGRMYAPVDKILNAHADVKVEKIRAIAVGTIPIAARAAERIAYIEERRQQNIEHIVATAVRELPKQVFSEPVDPDWIAAFFESCKDVSAEHMQQIWARMLAGEVSNPGSFSRRTLAVVQSMTKSEAESFTRFCSLAFEIDKATYGFVVPNYDVIQFIRANTMSTREELHLKTIGLLSPSARVKLLVASFMRSTAEYRCNPSAP